MKFCPRYIHSLYYLQNCHCVDDHPKMTKYTSISPHFLQEAKHALFSLEPVHTLVIVCELHN